MESEGSRLCVPRLVSVPFVCLSCSRLPCPAQLVVSLARSPRGGILAIPSIASETTHRCSISSSFTNSRITLVAAAMSVSASRDTSSGAPARMTEQVYSHSDGAPDLDPVPDNDSDSESEEESVSEADKLSHSRHVSLWHDARAMVLLILLCTYCVRACVRTCDLVTDARGARQT